MRNRGGSHPVGDPRLKQRVKQYLSSNKCGQYVDIGILAADLQKTYSADYGRRKRNAFRIQVEKVFGIISKELKSEDLETTEHEHLAKQARHRGGKEDSESCMDTSDTDTEQPSSNYMNTSLLTLYRKENPDSLPETAVDVLTKSSTAPQVTSDTRISEGGWFIDKTPARKEDSFFIDLCAEEESDSSKQTAEKDLSFVKIERKKPKSKRFKRRREDSQDVDEEVESALWNRKGKPKGIELQTSSIKFEDVGGIDKVLKEICKMLIHIRHPEVYHHLGAVPPRGFLLHGPPGCGKTLLAQAIAGEIELPILKVAATEMVSGVSGESEQKLRELFDQAVASSPCILFIDEIDAITPKREVASKDMERRIVAQLLTCMDDLNNLASSAQVLVIGATNRPDSLDPALRRAGRFDREICLGIPDEMAREKILKTLCRKLRLPELFDFGHLARMTPGYVGADLMALCREAAMSTVNRVLVKLEQEKSEAQSSEEKSPGQDIEKKLDGLVKKETEVPELPTKDELKRLLWLLKNPDPLGESQLQKLCIEMNDFIVALSSVQPSAKREGFVTVPDVTWADIGALEDIREELTMAILAPVRNPEQFKALGLTAPAGVLLAGPPGCGKTLLAKAVANESGLNFISVKGPELLNMYVGESERAVRQVFQRARNSAPCVIFFDEVDALCPRRSDHESGSSVRVVNQLLTEMDGLESRRQVFIMAATNRPDIIDPAILRPGRLDKTLYVGLPPPLDRLAILKTITKDGTRPPFDVDVDLEEIAHDPRCNYYTGADLSALVREASVCALRQEMMRVNTMSRAGADPEKPYVVQSDASDTGLGAVLLQTGLDGELHPIVFLSKKLLPRERNLSVIEKECLGIVWSLTKLRPYLWGQQFELQTDHSPLCWLDRVKNTNQKLLRWSLALQDFDFNVTHISGKSNVIADKLSRLYAFDESREIKINKKHFEEAFKKVKSSVSRKDQIMYEELRHSLSR